jgi:AcrR family transcriptional regulator
VLVPKLWTETIEAHRAAVREAALDAAAALIAEHGLGSVTMSRIAAETGIGRATLYKYFPDVETVLLAWHERQISNHLTHLAEVADRLDEPGARLEAVCQAYAHIRYQVRAAHGELAALLHRGDHVAHAHRQLHEFVTRLLTDAANVGRVRSDVAAGEVAAYCLHALGAAGAADSPEAVERLVDITLTGIRAAVGMTAVGSGSGANRPDVPTAAQAENPD